MGEKIKWLQEQMTQMIDAEQLTSKEQQQLLQQLASKLQVCEQQIAAAAEGSSQASKLKKQQQLLAAKQGAIQQLTPIVPKSKYAAEVKSIQAKLKALDKIASSKQLLPVEELQKLNQRPTLENRLKEIKEEEAGWFS